ncbi:MAG: glycosyltransferase family 4 protein [Endomicrobiales bacterium]
MKSFIEHPSFLIFLTFAISIAISYALTPVFRFLAVRFNILDHPYSDIKTHRVPTPYLGGLAIWSGWVISLFVIRLLTHFPTGTLRSLRGVLIGSLVIITLGLIDDVMPGGLGFKKKFVIQTLAALVLLVFSIHLQFISPYPVALAFSILWVIGITNAFNIVDIMDGLSSGIAVVASLAFVFIALPTEQIYVNFSAAALAGGCLGFLPYNLSKNRKIFMGDTGSLTIGFILAAVSMGTSYTRFNDIALLAPLLILAIPMYDTFLVMYLRWRKGMSPFLGSKDHFALRLEKLGFSRRQILVITVLACTILSVGAYLVTRLPLAGASVLVTVFVVAALFISLRLSKVKID